MASLVLWEFLFLSFALVLCGFYDLSQETLMLSTLAKGNRAHIRHTSQNSLRHELFRGPLAHAKIHEGKRLRNASMEHSTFSWSSPSKGVFAPFLALALFGILHQTFVRTFKHSLRRHELHPSWVTASNGAVYVPTSKKGNVGKRTLKEQPLPIRGMPVWLLSGEYAIPQDGEWDLVFDCRTPLEYTEDHIPGAINTPVLSNEQRVTIGTLYKKSAFEAQRLGAAMIAGNIAEIIPKYLSDVPRATRILVYCWRGGERSGSLAHVLSRVGWHTAILEGGYKTYRKLVMTHLTDLSACKFHVIAGLTGTGKGALLDALREQGANVLDLEGLARHYGSNFGDHQRETQPSQKSFESSLLHAINQMQHPGPIFVECESPKIGKVALPRSLVEAMRLAEVTEISLPLDERVKRIRQQYHHFEGESVDQTIKKIQLLKARIGTETMQRWLTLVEQGDFKQFVSEILVSYYDPLYSHASTQRKQPMLTLHLDGASSSYHDAASTILKRLGFLPNI